MDGWIDVIDASVVGDGQLVEAEVEGHHVLVTVVDGTPYIADAHCPHMGGPLPKGKLDGTVLTCPWHHSQFDLTDGHVVRWTDWTGPVKTMSEFVRHPRPLRVYEAKIEHERIWIGPQKEPPPVVT
ncbi:MAG: Rieske (2Fe-2S) protein [Coriobacteriales bacterium]|nr:Rieske (2Fe-2S) protein [Coriobacteriales bacterium]